MLDSENPETYRWEEFQRAECQTVYDDRSEANTTAGAGSSSQPLAVINIHDAPAGWQYDSQFAYIGRDASHAGAFLPASPFANQFTGDGAITKFREHLQKNPDLTKKAIVELAGKTLICWCKPKPCHGDVLAEIVRQGQPSHDHGATARPGVHAGDDRHPLAVNPASQTTTLVDLPGHPCPRCRRSTQFRDTRIHNGLAVRRDCAACKKFVSFPVWDGSG